MKKTLKTVVIVLAGLMLLALVLTLGYYRFLLGKVTMVQTASIVTTESETIATTAETTQPLPTETEHIASPEDYINILVVGQSARDGEDARFADTSLLCTINTYEKTITTTSLLRDSFVKMPTFKGHSGGHIKLCTIYHLGSYFSEGDPAGSMELMNQTLYDNFGIEVDGNVEIDFDAFIALIDALDGIDIDLTEAEANYMNRDTRWVYEEVHPGMNHLDGCSALSYARMRKATGDGDSDIKRTARQRKVMELIFERMHDLSTMDLKNLAEALLPYVTTNMDEKQIFELLKTLLPMAKDMTFVPGGTCPVEYSGSMVDIYDNGFYHSVLKFSPQKTKEAMRLLTKGIG